jgi:hypothetical protein
MIIFRVDRVHLGNQDFGHVMFLARLVHDVPSDMRADAGIKDFFFEEGVNLQLGQGLIDDLCIGALTPDWKEDSIAVECFKSTKPEI